MCPVVGQVAPNFACIYECPCDCSSCDQEEQTRQEDKATSGGTTRKPNDTIHDEAVQNYPCKDAQHTEGEHAEVIWPYVPSVELEYDTPVASLHHNQNEEPAQNNACH